MKKVVTEQQLEALTVEYVDSIESNFYDPARKTVVLDKKLKERPRLHERILEHELTHWRNDVESSNVLENIVRDLALEIQRDYRFYFKLNDCYKEDTEYLKGLRKEEYGTLDNIVVNGVRAFTASLTLLVSIPYKAVLRFSEVTGIGKKENRGGR